MRSQSLSYMPAIDGLRAVAIALVFVIHVFPDSSFPGEVGVDVFFVISGFLITLILIRRLERTGSIELGQFYFNRAARLYPPLIVVCVASLVISVLPGQSVTIAARSAGIAVTYLGNVYMTLTGRWLGDLSHTWSLAMEEQFYLVWPLLLLVLFRRRWTLRSISLVLGVVAALMLVGWTATGVDLPNNPLTRGVGLVVGCILALVTHERPRDSVVLAWAGVVGFAAMLGAGSWGWISHTSAVPLAVLCACPVILHLAHGSGVLVRALSYPSVVYVGLISYELYLWHYVVIAGLFDFADLPQWGVGILALALSLALSVLTHRLVSVPVLRWRDRRRSVAPAPRG